VELVIEHAHEMGGDPYQPSAQDAAGARLLVTNNDMTHVVEIFEIRANLDDEPEWMAFCQTHHGNVYDDPADVIADAIEWAEKHVARGEQ
jgi:hypothetical protein